jgi:cytochrome c-type biogenesis protein
MVLFEEIAFTAAFTAGLLSFLSPCILPLVPSYFSFITGISVDNLTQTADGAARRKIIMSTSAFVLGFSVIFILLGATAAFFSGLIYEASAYLRVAGGIMIMLLGLHLLGILRIRALNMDKRIHLNKKPVHFFGALVIGMAFAAGWSPCIGPLLGSVLILAANQDTVSQGMGLLTIYSAGLALPFMLLSMGIHYMLRFVRRASKAVRYINIIAGVLLIITGLLLMTDSLSVLSFFYF